MAFDALTIAAILGALVAGGVMMFLQGSRHRRTEARVHHLQEELRRLNQYADLPTHASRELCCAIHRIYPHAVYGVDYRLADEGGGPYIKEWLMGGAPRPKDRDLAEALNAHRVEMAKHTYREARRAAYPGVTDQLDALYKARRGDTRELEVLDETIARIKARYPKPEDCEESCG